jgi:hypothetical protein
LADGNAGVSQYSGAAPGTVVSSGELLARAGMGGAAGYATAPVNSYVYMGPEYERQDMVPPPVSRSPAAADYQSRRAALTGYRPIDVAVVSFDMFSPDQRRRWSKLAKDYVGYDVDTERERALWASFAERAGQVGQLTQQPVSPWALIEQSAAYESQRRGGSGGGGGAYTGPVTQVRLTDPDTAMGLIDQSLQSALGRSASQKEKQNFMEALRKYEMANPTVTTGDQTGSVTTGGSNPQMFAQRFARAQEGSAEYEVATTYLDAFLGALGNPVG